MSTGLGIPSGKTTIVLQDTKNAGDVYKRIREACPDWINKVTQVGDKVHVEYFSTFMLEDEPVTSLTETIRDQLQRAGFEIV